MSFPPHIGSTSSNARKRSKRIDSDLDFDNNRSDSDNESQERRRLEYDDNNDDDDYPLATSHPREELEVYEHNRERVFCNCNHCKGKSRRMRRVQLRHIKKYGAYEPLGMPIPCDVPVNPPPLNLNDFVVPQRQDCRALLVNETEGLVLQNHIADQLTTGLIAYFANRHIAQHSSIGSCEHDKGGISHMSANDILLRHNECFSTTEKSTRVTRHGGRSNFMSVAQSSMTICSRFGDIFLTGSACRVFREVKPSWFDNPSSIIFDVEFLCWDRRWIIKTSTLGNETGMGVFACEDIIVDPDTPPRYYPELFPYFGPVYGYSDWTILSRAHPRFKTYVLSVDEGDTRVLRGDKRFIDGDPMRSHNISGFINSVKGTDRIPNVEWIHIEGSHERFTQWMEVSVVTVAYRTIRAHDEILCNYDFCTIKI